MKKALSLILATLFVLSTMSCLSVVSFGADVIYTEIENNDSSSSAQLIATNTTQIGSLSDVYDADWYKFTNDGSYFEIEFRNNDSVELADINWGWSIFLYNSNKELLKSYENGTNDATQIIYSATLPYEGDFYIKVTNNYLSKFSSIDEYDAQYVPIGQPYELTIYTTVAENWEKEENTYYHSVNNISTNTKYTGVLSTLNDADWYKFTNDGSYFELKFKSHDDAWTNGINWGWSVYIYNSDKVLLKSYTAGVRDAVQKINTAKLPFEGDFYVKVVSNYSSQFSNVSSGDAQYMPIDQLYELTIVTTQAENWEREDNLTQNKINKISTNKKYTGVLSTVYDVDWYEFTNDGEYFEIEFNNHEDATHSSINWGWSIYLYDSNYELIEYYTSGTNDAPQKIYSYRFPCPGEYFIKIVNNYSSKFGEPDEYDAQYIPVDQLYELTIHTSNANKWEDENWNKGLTSATSIKKDIAYYGNLYSKNDNDYYKFTIPTDGTVKLTFKREDSEYVNGGYYIYLINSKEEVVSQYHIGKSKSFDTKEVSLKKGTYYWVVVSANTDAPSVFVDYNIKYTFKINAPKLKKIENTTTGVKISWGKVNGADSYEIYRKTGSGSYKKIGTTTKTYYTDKNASSGKKYYYVVKAVEKKEKSVYSKSLSILHLADTTLKTPSSTKSGVTLKWSKVTGAEGYMVYRKTGSGSYSKIATVKGNSKVTYTDKSAKKGKKYTYKVKAYKSKTYSAYSNTKTITDKY